VSGEPLMTPANRDLECSRLARFLARYLDAECADVAAALSFVRPGRSKPPGYYQVRYTITYLALLVLAVPIGLVGGYALDRFHRSDNASAVLLSVVTIAPLAYFGLRKFGSTRLPHRGSAEMAAMLAKIRRDDHRPGKNEK